ncbi:MAG: ATP-dependent zinc metalloprotease FtsH [Planctomycetota bacterium]
MPEGSDKHGTPPERRQPRQQGPEGGPPKPGFKFPRGIFPLLMLITAGILLASFILPTTEKMTNSDFDSLLRENKIKEIVYYTDADEADFIYKDYDKEGQIVEKKGTIDVDKEFFSEDERKALIKEQESRPGGLIFDRKKRTPGWLNTLLWLGLPLLLFGFLIYFLFFRQSRMMGGMPGGIMGFGRSRAKLANANRPKITFDDVAGVEEAKEEVREIIEFLRNPQRFRKLGGRIPRGVLLIGPPGTGKTLLAKAISGEANVPFFNISGSDFVEMFVGVGASRVRDLFRQAKESAPCIIFLDEVDAVGRKRGFDPTGSERESNQTLNAILVEMDGFDTDEKIILLAATNRPDVLDPALLRPGRFDREVVLDLPDLRGREAILKVHARNVTLEPDVDWSVIARMTPMLSGADLEAVINEAAIMAVMRNKEAISMKELEDARDKTMFGRERRSRVMDEADRRITAYHEAGHAMLASVLKGVDPLHKVGIIPRGMSIGSTMSIPKKDVYHMSRKRLLGKITMALGGRVSEEIFCDDITSGAQSDIEEATRLARYMVTKWGMSENLGPVDFSERDEHPFFVRELPVKISEATALKIDAEINNIISECLERARELVRENKEKTSAIAEALLRYETLDATDVDWVLEGKDLAERKSKVTQAVDDEPAAGSEDRQE